MGKKKLKFQYRDITRVRLMFLEFFMIILLLGLFFELNINGWAILIAILLFFLNEVAKQIKYFREQEDILMQILNDIEYISNKEEGHIKLYRDSLIPKGYPHHNISELNLGFYLPSVAHKINSVSTLELKNNLKRANDKIIMLNNYRENDETWKKMLIHGRSTFATYGFLKKVLNELETALQKIKEIIIKDFRVGKKKKTPLF